MGVTEGKETRGWYEVAVGAVGVVTVEAVEVVAVEAVEVVRREE